MRKLILSTLILLSVNQNFSYANEMFYYRYSTALAQQANEVDWKPILKAIAKIESKGNPKSVSKDGKCVGILQIKKVVVDDCNEYLRMKGSKKRFTLQDRYSIEKSHEMFKLIQERYNKSNDINTALKIWNQGCSYYKSKTTLKKANEYCNLVLSKVEKE